MMLSHRRADRRLAAAGQAAVEPEILRDQVADERRETLPSPLGGSSVAAEAGGVQPLSNSAPTAAAPAPPAPLFNWAKKGSSPMHALRSVARIMNRPQPGRNRAPAPQGASCTRTRRTGRGWPTPCPRRSCWYGTSGTCARRPAVARHDIGQFRDPGVPCCRPAGSSCGGSYGAKLPCRWALLLASAACWINPGHC